MNGGRRGAGERTVGEDPVDVQAVGGARLVVGAAPHVGAELPGAGVADDPRVAAADLICNITGVRYTQGEPRVLFQSVDYHSSWGVTAVISVDEWGGGTSFIYIYGI